MKLKIGKRYKAIGNCGMTKDKEVEGIVELGSFGEYIIKTDKGTIHSINENTAIELFE